MIPSRSAKVPIIFMGLVAAIAVTGMGFGLWSQILTVDTQVQTGQVIVEFQEVLGFGVFTDDDGIVNDPGELGFLFDDGEEDPNGFGGPPAIQIYDGNGSASSADPAAPSFFEGSRYDKDVGICTAETSLDTQGRETILEITISNSYPSYWCTTYFPVKNTGSVPVKLQSTTLTSVLPPLDFGFFFWCVDIDGFSLPVVAEGGSFGNGCPEADGDILVQSPEDYDIAIGVCPPFEYPFVGIGIQIDPSPSEFEGGIGCIMLHVEQGSEQSDEETFEIEMLWVQWNEFVEPEGPPLGPL